MPGTNRNNRWRFSAAAFFAACGLAASGQELLDTLDDSLYLRSPNGFIRSDLSGLLDLELYYNDQVPPGLVIADDRFFFNPRLSLFLDTKIGSRLYSMLHLRFDRGFDPGARRDGDIRFDEYLLRYTPTDGPEFNIQAGKFATVIGNWVPRHLSWDNPFINAPLPYENVTVVSDRTAPASKAAFLGRRALADKKGDWLPMIWGPSYTTGASIFGRVDRYDYAFEIKNAAISSRPFAWDPTEVGWDHPTVSGRIGIRPDVAWNIGANASYGAYMLPDAAGLPAGTGPGDYRQLTVGPDLGFAWHHWQFWAEAFATRFEVPNVGDVESLAYYLEAKYKISSRWFVAGRWNQQFFDEIPDGAGGEARWDRDAWRVETAVGYRYSQHVQAKLQYGYNHENGPRPEGEQFVAAQFTLKF